MTDVGPMFLAAVLAETFEDFSDDGIANEAGQLLHDALTRHGYELVPAGSAPAPDGDEYERGWQEAMTAASPPRTAERAAANAAVTGLMRRFSGALGHVADDMDRIARAMEALDVEPGGRGWREDAAWGTVHLYCWRKATEHMTNEEREAAAVAVERDWARVEDSRAALRWWEQ